jgi:hypothetical protein
MWKDKNFMAPDKKILFKKQLFDLEVFSVTVCHFTLDLKYLMCTPRQYKDIIAICYLFSVTVCHFTLDLKYLMWKDKNFMAPDKKILFKKQLFDLEVKGQGPTKVITVRDTPPYGHALTYQISLTYLERQKSCPGHNIFVF